MAADVDEPAKLSVARGRARPAASPPRRSSAGRARRPGRGVPRTATSGRRSAPAPAAARSGRQVPVEQAGAHGVEGRRGQSTLVSEPYFSSKAFTMDRSPVSKLRVAATKALAIVACGALASGAAATPSASPSGIQLQPVKSYLLKHGAPLRFHDRLPRRREPLLRGGQGLRLRLRSSAPRSVACSRPGRRQGAVDQGQSVLRARRGPSPDPVAAIYDVILDAGSSAKETRRAPCRST